MVDLRSGLVGALIAALLTTTWPGGRVAWSACVDAASCRVAAGFDLARGATKTVVRDGLTPAQAGFPPGWDCIEGENVPRKARCR